MPYDLTMIQHFADDAEKSRAGASPVSGDSAAMNFADGANANAGANDAAVARIATSPYSVPQSNVDDLNGFQKMLLIRRPDVAALFGIRNPDRDNQRYAQERKDLAQMLGEYNEGLRSQMTRSGVFDQFADDRTRKALMSSQEWQDMVMFRAAMDKSGKALEELAAGRHFQPNVQSLMSLARSLGYNLTMDDGGKIYLENGDGQQMELTNENIKMLGDEAMKRFNSRVEKLKMGDSNWTALTGMGQATDYGRDVYGSVLPYGEANDRIVGILKRAKESGDPSLDAYCLFSSFDRLSAQYSNLEQNLLDGMQGMSPQSQVLLQDLQQTLGRHGVQISTANGRMEFTVPDGAFGLARGTYGMKEFFNRVGDVLGNDQGSILNQILRDGEEVKAKKATQEMADAINRDALKQNQQLQNEQNAKHEAERNAYLKLAVEMGLVNEDSLASLSDEQKDALIAQVQEEQKQKQAKQDADYERRKRDLALQNMEADLQNKQNRGAGGTGKGKEDGAPGSGNETAEGTRELTPEEKEDVVFNFFGDKSIAFNGKQMDIAYDYIRHVNSIGKKYGFYIDGKWDKEAIQRPENYKALEDASSEIDKLGVATEKLGIPKKAATNPLRDVLSAIRNDRANVFAVSRASEYNRKRDEVDAIRTDLRGLYKELYGDWATNSDRDSIDVIISRLKHPIYGKNNTLWGNDAFRKRLDEILRAYQKKNDELDRHAGKTRKGMENIVKNGER